MGVMAVISRSRLTEWRLWFNAFSGQGIELLPMEVPVMVVDRGEGRGYHGIKATNYSGRMIHVQACQRRLLVKRRLKVKQGQHYID